MCGAFEEPNNVGELWANHIPKQNRWLRTQLGWGKASEKKRAARDEAEREERPNQNKP